MYWTGITSSNTWTSAYYCCRITIRSDALNKYWHATKHESYMTTGSENAIVRLLNLSPYPPKARLSERCNSACLVDLHWNNTIIINSFKKSRHPRSTSYNFRVSAALFQKQSAIVSRKIVCILQINHISDLKTGLESLVLCILPPGHSSIKILPVFVHG